MTQDTDDRWMAYALTLGARGQGHTWPNPAVGCVLVKDDRVVGRGWTQPGGRPHAEVVALKQAGASAVGATAYVTLEPCAHTGKTGPCCQALADAKVARVVVATTDPDERVRGQGIAYLRDQGISVDVGCLQAQADMAHAGFFSRLSKGRPRVTLKLALSLDGRIATASGESQWITGPAARRHVHLDRLQHDAVMVGGGTARADDPSLTVRGFGLVQQPVRIIASSKLDFDGGALKRDLPDAPLWLLHSDLCPQEKRNNWTDAGAGLINVAREGSHLEVHAALQELGTKGLTSVYCEGGGSFAASLLAGDLVDDVVVYHAGVIIGAEGIPGLGALEHSSLASCPRFTLKDYKQIGPDIRQHWARDR